ncbi:TPA: hypothetical protein J0T38_000996 [Enterococcus faecium]|nr:hypothetical protein [Enterococcus faecium]
MRAMTEAVKELKKMYPDVLNMTVDDFHEALKNAESEVERTFYLTLSSFVTRVDQKKVINQKDFKI